MAAHIFHGPPGSYKSASVVWFRLLDELRKGRLVVTNIEGILDKESIEIELNETFPEGAEIWRLSSQTDAGMFLWRRWFWWMPVKAFIILDEVQDVFPADTTVFKPIQFDIPEGENGIEVLKSKLPDNYYQHFYSVIDEFTPDADDLTDDTGQEVLDKNGNIIYPKTMREANMRHRKYNWDIVYCTPEITEIHKLIRSVCEFAYCHKYHEQFEFIPYFKRRPRIHEHNPKGSGFPLRKGDPIKWPKIPIQVHKLYRSTSTGKTSSAGGGTNGFKSPTLIFVCALLLMCFTYIIWWGFFQESDSDALATPENSTQENRQGAFSSPDISNDINNYPHNSSNTVSIALPFNSEEIYFNGFVEVIPQNKPRYRQYTFTLVKGGSEYVLDGDTLKQMGFTIRYVNECSIRLYNEQNEYRFVYCPPKPKLRPIQQEPVISI